MNYSPIVLFVYNRLEHTRKTIEAIQKNTLAKNSELFIFEDGPREQDSTSNIKEVREYIKSVTGFKNVTINESIKNNGLANSIILGVTEIVNKYGKVIVLEDDLITSPFFLDFMNKGLDFYENQEKVISIHGYVYPTKKILPETFFLKNPSCWGWATWKRGWDFFEKDGKKLLENIEKRNLLKEFDFNNSYNFSGMLRKQVMGKNDSWAIRWYASAFLADKLTLYPGRSLVENIGFDGSGIHSNRTSMFDSTITKFPIVVNNIKIEENKSVRQVIIKYFKSIKPNMLRRFYWKIKKLLPVKVKILILNFILNIKKKAQIIIGKIQNIKVVKPNLKLPNYYMFKNGFSKNATIIDVGCGFDADFSRYMIKTYGLKAIGIDPTLKHQNALQKISETEKGQFRHILAAVSGHDGKISFNESEENVSGSILETHRKILTRIGKRIKTEN